eukprot:gene16995-23271_t
MAQPAWISGIHHLFNAWPQLGVLGFGNYTACSDDSSQEGGMRHVTGTDQPLLFVLKVNHGPAAFQRHVFQHLGGFHERGLTHLGCDASINWGDLSTREAPEFSARTRRAPDSHTNTTRYPGTAGGPEQTTRNKTSKRPAPNHDGPDRHPDPHPRALQTRTRDATQRPGTPTVNKTRTRPRTKTDNPTRPRKPQPDQHP